MNMAKMSIHVGTYYLVLMGKNEFLWNIFWEFFKLVEIGRLVSYSPFVSAVSISF